MSDWEYPGEGGLQDIRSRTLKRSGRVTLDSDGVATIAFTPPIIMDRQPYVVLTPHITAQSSGIIAANVVAGSYTQDGDGRYTGCSIAAAELKAKLPVLTSLNIVVELNNAQLLNRNGVDGEEVDWMAF